MTPQRLLEQTGVHREMDSASAAFQVPGSGTHSSSTSPNRLPQAPAGANLSPFSSSHSKDKASQASSSAREAPGPLKRGPKQGT